MSGLNGKYYERDGRRYERFSTIANYFPHPDLVNWKIRVGKAAARQVSNKALKIGTRVDHLCEDNLKTGLIKFKKSDPIEIHNCMTAWEKWKEDWADVASSIDVTQQTVYHKDWGIAGTLDLLSPTHLIDIKTSKKISLMYWIQTAVYNRGLGRECWILRLDKENGAYEFVKRPDEFSQEYLETVFVGMVNVFNFFRTEEEL